MTARPWLTVKCNPPPWQPDCHAVKINSISIDSDSVDISVDIDSYLFKTHVPLVYGEAAEFVFMVKL